MTMKLGFSFALAAIIALSSSLLLTVRAATVDPDGFVIIGGQIFTPGLAIIDAPQPNTPLGGDFLQVALDVSGDGKLGLPPYPNNALTEIFTITMFLTSYVTGLNLSISNGTAGSNMASLGDIMAQESGSTVKHVNWVWPDCLVGDGQASSSSSSRGSYNISIHQSFLLNSTSHFTIFTLPISVTNRINPTFNPSSSISLTSNTRPSCASLSNLLLSPAILAQSADSIPPSLYPFTPGNGIQVLPPASSPSPSLSLSPSPSPSPATSIGSATIVVAGGLGETSTTDGATTATVTTATTATVSVSVSVSASATTTPVVPATVSVPTTMSAMGSAASQSSNLLGSVRPEGTPGDGLGGSSRMGVDGRLMLGVILVAAGIVL